MSYTERDLFAYMDAGQPVRVTSKAGNVHEGMCWAYSAAYNADAEDREEASIEVGNVSVYLSEIKSIEYL